MTRLPHWKTYFDPSTQGADDEEVLQFAQHLRTHATLGINGQEALRMADAQQPAHRAATTRKAVEQAIRELFERDAA